MIDDPEELAKAWQDWVATNLGRDTDRGDVAARAATAVALQGSGFEAAATAARESWLSTQPARPNAQTLPAATSPALRIAMAIAIGGCLASAVLAAGLAIAIRGVGSVAMIFLFYNLGLAGVNGVLFASMRRGSRRAWTVAVILVILGIVFDLVEQGAMWSAGPFASVVAVPGIFIAIGVGFPFYAPGIDGHTIWAVVNDWLGIHLLTIQVPILVALIAGRPGAVAQPAAAP